MTGNHPPASFTEILADVRHDLRTPAGHLIGYSEMIIEDLEDEGVTTGLEALQEVNATGHQLVELIDELLGASRSHPSELDPAAIRRRLGEALAVAETTCVGLADDVDEAWADDLAKIRSACERFRDIIETRVTVAHLAAADAPSSPQPAGREDPTPVTAATVSPISSLAEGGEILIVDDDPANRDLLSRRLSRQGYTPVTVDCGEAALDLLAERAPDLILLDMMMPGLSGAEVLDRLKKDQGLKNIPVIMLSALDDVTQVVQCILMGAEDYLVKPFNPVLLKARIGASLEKYRLRRQQALKLRVFISSPGDVSPERQAVKEVIKRLNDELAGQVYLVPVLWEDEPLLASETAQTQIVLPRVTDIFVAILWARMGTRLPDDIRREDGSIYLSGTEFEFEDALNEAKRSGRPDMLMYRKTAEPLVSLSNRQEILDRLDQKERLETFIKQWFTSPDGESISGVYHAFETVEELQPLVETHLRKLALKHLAEVRDGG